MEQWNSGTVEHTECEDLFFSGWDSSHCESKLKVLLVYGELENAGNLDFMNSNKVDDQQNIPVSGEDEGDDSR